MTTDLLRALKFLAAQPNIDSKKIVVMGSSKGAVAALYATWNPIRQKIVGDLDFAGYVLLYPLYTTIEDGKVTTIAVHVYIGKIGYPLRSRDVNMLGWRTRHPIPKAGSTTRAP